MEAERDGVVVSRRAVGFSCQRPQLLSHLRNIKKGITNYLMWREGAEPRSECFLFSRGFIQEGCSAPLISFYCYWQTAA